MEKDNKFNKKVEKEKKKTKQNYSRKRKKKWNGHDGWFCHSNKAQSISATSKKSCIHIESNGLAV